MCETKTCRIGDKSKLRSEDVTVFTAKWCGACKQRVPQIVKRAQAAGLKVNLIDIDDADSQYRRMLSRVAFVPHIDYMGREIEEENLTNYVKKTVEADKTCIPQDENPESSQHLLAESRQVSR